MIVRKRRRDSGRTRPKHGHPYLRRIVDKCGATAATGHTVALIVKIPPRKNDEDDDEDEDEGGGVQKNGHMSFKVNSKYVTSRLMMKIPAQRIPWRVHGGSPIEGIKDEEEGGDENTETVQLNPYDGDTHVPREGIAANERFVEIWLFTPKKEDEEGGNPKEENSADSHLKEEEDDDEREEENEQHKNVDENSGAAEEGEKEDEDEDEEVPQEEMCNTRWLRAKAKKEKLKGGNMVPLATPRQLREMSKKNICKLQPLCVGSER